MWGVAKQEEVGKQNEETEPLFLENQSDVEKEAGDKTMAVVCDLIVPFELNQSYNTTDIPGLI